MPVDIATVAVERKRGQIHDRVSETGDSLVVLDDGPT